MSSPSSSQVQGSTRRHEQKQPATPPLSPRKDINAMSPSPLRIRGDFDGQRDSLQFKSSTFGSIFKSMDFSARGASSATTGKANEDKENIPNPTPVTGLKKQHVEDAKSQLPKTVEKDLKASMLAMSLDDLSGNAVAADIESGSSTKEAPKPTSSSLSLHPDSAQSSATDTKAGNKYISPSDALMSPCTEKLTALKGKKLARANGKAAANDSGVRRLFAGRIQFPSGQKTLGSEVQAEPKTEESGEK